MKNWIIWTIMGLLLLIALLLAIDIFTAIWYINRLNLSFSSTAFNNIITPITGIFAVGIYSIALFFTIKQNKTINSFTIKDEFMKEIPKFKEEALNQKIELKTVIEVDYVNFFDKLYAFFEVLRLDEQYNIDKDKEQELNNEELKSKSYYPQAFFLQKFIFHHNTPHAYYNELKKYINKVLNSDLIFEHKRKIIIEIEKELIHDYLKFVSFVEYSKKRNNPKRSDFILLIHDMNYKNPFNYVWRGIEETDFMNFNNWYREIKMKFRLNIDN
jgi:hypothetical protein